MKQTPWVKEDDDEKKKREIRFPWKFWFGRSGAHTTFRETHTVKWIIKSLQACSKCVCYSYNNTGESIHLTRTATTTTTIKQQQQRTISECRSLMDDLNVCHMKQTSERKKSESKLSRSHIENGGASTDEAKWKNKKEKTLCANWEQNIYHFVIARTIFFRSFCFIRWNEVSSDGETHAGAVKSWVCVEW